MSQQDRGPTAKPAQPEGGPVSPLEPDPEWEAMEAMMDRIARMPVKIDTADVPVATGYANAAHAVGPITLHEGIDTQPPQARVIIGEQVLPTQVIPRGFEGLTDTKGRNWRAAILVAVGGAVLLAALATAWALFSRPNEGDGPAAPVDSTTLPTSSVAAARTNHVAPVEPPSTPRKPLGVAPAPEPPAVMPTMPTMPAASAASAPATSASAPPPAILPKPVPTANGVAAPPARSRPGHHSSTSAAVPSPVSTSASAAPTNSGQPPSLRPSPHDNRKF